MAQRSSFFLTFGPYLGSDEGMECFKWGSQIWHSMPFPKNSFQNPCCVPGSSPANPMKIPNVAVPTVSNMTMPSQGKTFKDVCFVWQVFLPSSSHSRSCPNLFPLFSRNIPRSLLDPSQIVPTSFPVVPRVPNSFPWFSQILLGFDYMSSLEADFCRRCSLLKETNRFLIVSLEILKFFPAHSMTSLAKRFLDSLLILLVPTQAEAAPIEAARLATQR